MNVFELPLASGRRADVAVVGPDDGDPVLYFHSPSTSAEELRAATSAATAVDCRFLSVRRASIRCDETDLFVGTVA